jgi:hypothetical protein
MDCARDIYAERCACGTALEEAGQELARAWNHVDLPPTKPITTRINLFRATCPCANRAIARSRLEGGEHRTAWLCRAALSLDGFIALAGRQSPPCTPGRRKS